MKRYFIILALFICFVGFGQEYRPIYKNKDGLIYLNKDGLMYQASNTLVKGLVLDLRAYSISEDSLTYNSSTDLVTYSNADTVVLDGSSEVVINNSVRFGISGSGTIYQILDTLGSSDSLILDQIFTGSVTDEFFWGGINTWYDESGEGNNLYQSTPDKMPKLLGYNTSNPKIYFDGVDDVLQAADGTVLDLGTSDMSINYKMEFIQPAKAGNEYYLTKGGGAQIGYSFYKNDSKVKILYNGDLDSGFGTFHDSTTGNHTNTFVFDYDNIISGYVDEVFESNVDISNLGDPSTTYLFTLGAYGAIASTAFFTNMSIEYLQIYDRKLSIGEIKALNNIENDIAYKRMYIDDSKYYISDKFGTEKDFVIEFDSCMYNDLMSFRQLSTNDNTGINPKYDIESTPDDILINLDASDVVGPYNLKNYGFVSANHGYLGDLVNVTSAYTPGDGVLNIADASGFIQSGGIARTGTSIQFNYTGVSGNQLTGVDLASSLTTSDQVRIYPLTAITDDYTFYVDGVAKSSGRFLGNTDEVIVNNTVYDPGSLSVIDGSMNDLLTEHVIYNYDTASIEVDFTFTMQKQDTLLIYYGMQWPNLDSVYFPNGENTDIQLISNGLNSGQHGTYNIDRAIMKGTVYNVALWVDNSIGIGASRLLDVADPIFFTTQFKLYNQFISTESVLLDQAEYRWKGVFTIFENLSNAFSFSYIMSYDNNDYLYIDWHQQAVDTIDFHYSGITIQEQVGNISFEFLTDNKLRIETTSNYGNVKGLLRQ
jgi:hypothetical protein